MMKLFAYWVDGNEEELWCLAESSHMALRMATTLLQGGGYTVHLLPKVDPVGEHLKDKHIGRGRGYLKFPYNYFGGDTNELVYTPYFAFVTREEKIDNLLGV